MNFRQEVKTHNGQVNLVGFSAENHHARILQELSLALNKEIVWDMITRNSLGKPELVSENICFNWTHSRDACVLAYSFEMQVGIDLEFHRARSLAIAARFFSAEENMFLRTQVHSDQDRIREFYRLWCRKEAYFKCRGGAFMGGVLSLSMLENTVGGVELHDLQGNFPAEHSLCLAASGR
ncbi:MAG: 4'-phosphopantetheinyl transferase superfamily protein [Fibrobacter sp.]|jgi:phosphopantetheinyl transferase|nr:4'-phosphopantetheinyl transferase superfamily protein [Fibrobacter sp.]